MDLLKCRPSVYPVNVNEMMGIILMATRRMVLKFFPPKRT